MGGFFHSFYVVNISKYNLIIALGVKGHSWVPLGLFFSKMEGRGYVKKWPVVVVLECRNFLHLNFETFCHFGW